MTSRTRTPRGVAAQAAPAPRSDGAFKAAIAAPADWPAELKARLEAQIDRLAADQGTTRDVIVGFAQGFLAGVGAAKEAPQVQEAPKAGEPGKIAVRVRGPKVGRRRIGRQFADEAQDIDVTADELELLKADPELTVRQIA